MKWVVLIFCLPILASAGVDPTVSRSHFVQKAIDTFLATDGSNHNTETIDEYLEQVSAKRAAFRSDEAFLEFVFKNTHRKLLKNFKPYTSFGDLLKSGAYNCLTATALYALILEQSGIRYDIIETNYHIFLMAYTDDGNVLIESTDPQTGLVKGKADIEKRIAQYKQNTFANEGEKEYYQLDCNLYNTVTLEEMSGLLHYNLAIAAHNDGNLEASVFHLDQATAIYNSPRMEALTRLILLSVVESNMNQEHKTSLIRQIQAFRKRNLMALAEASR